MLISEILAFWSHQNRGGEIQTLCLFLGSWHSGWNGVPSASLCLLVYPHRGKHQPLARKGMQRLSLPVITSKPFYINFPTMLTCPQLVPTYHQTHSTPLLVAIRYFGTRLFESLHSRRDYYALWKMATIGIPRPHPCIGVRVLRKR